jgi:LemA protein
MSLSLLPWALAFVGVAWALGAYNRLVRLRAEVNTAFAAVDGELQPLARLVDDMLHGIDPDDEDRQEPSDQFLAPIRDASAALSAALVAARARPLEGPRIQALREAGEVWARAWDRAERADAHDLAGPQLPETVSTERALRLKQAEVIGSQFNAAVDRYNRAIGQFPAVIIALIFKFKSASNL